MEPLSLNSNSTTMQLSQLQLNRLNQLASGTNNQSLSPKQKDLMKAAQDFEGVFVHQVLEAMDKTIDREESYLGGGNTEEYFRSMLNEEVAKNISHGPNGFGLAQTIYKQMAANMDANSGQLKN